MSMKEKWINEPEEDLLRLLKTEIIRLECADNPNRHSIQKSYDNRNMPSPSFYETHFRMKWPELMQRIGLTLKDMRFKENRPSPKKWAHCTDDDLLRLLKEELNRLDIQGFPSIAEVQKRYDYRNMANPRSYPKRFGISWADILAKINYRYERSERKWSRYKWAEHSDADILQLLREELNRLALTDNPSMRLFQKSYCNDRVPSPTYSLTRFQYSWAEVLLKAGIRYRENK